MFHGKGYIFIVLIWLAFLLPAASWGAFPFIIGHTSISELAIIAMPFVYSLYPRKLSLSPHREYLFLRKTILLFFIMCIFINIAQFLVYGGSVADYFRANRPLIPLYVALSLIYLGPRISPMLLLVNLALCLSVSFLISIIYFFTDMQFTPFFETNFDEELYEIFNEGRIGNLSAGFSYLALGLVFSIYSYSKYLQSAWLYRVLLFTCVISIATVELSFSRTFMVVSALFLVFMNMRFFSFQKLFVTLFLIILSLFMFFYAYKFSEAVKQQVERRVFLTLQGQGEMLDNIYYNSRDVLYLDYYNAGRDFWAIGVPPNVPINQRFVKGELKTVNFSDTSLLTVFLRLGVIPLLIYFVIGLLLYRYILSIDETSHSPLNRVIRLSLLTALPFMALASFNVDILARHYSVLFVSLLFIALKADVRRIRKGLAELVNENKTLMTTI